MQLYKLVSSFSFLFLFTSFSFAQTDKIVKTNTNSWFVYAGVHKISPKWSIMPEFQYRRNDVLNKPMQILFRPGLMYHIHDNLNVAFGYAYVNTKPYGELPSKATFPENRTWQQMQTKLIAGRLEIVNRYRLEQRWVNVPVSVGPDYIAGDAVYSNRFRLMTKISVPLIGKTIHNKSLYAVIFDEMFVQWGKKVALNTWDQNRAFIGLGYRMSKFGRVEAGYLNQRIFKSDARTIENNHTISIWALSNIDFYKNKM